MTASRVTRRRYKLRPWVIRAVVPAGAAGAYVLFRDGLPTYIGRSATCLQRRLIAHAASARGEYFTFIESRPGIACYHAECELFHAVPPGLLTNRIHPAKPAELAAMCPYCPPAIELSRQLRTKLTDV